MHASSAPSSPVPLLNREQAILGFNRRVLAQAERPDVPLLERLRYICIVSSNLDEFFEVRFADVLEASRHHGAAKGSHDLETLALAAHQLINEQYRILNDVLTPLLQEQGITILNHQQRDEAQRRWVGHFFRREVLPLLTPIGLDPAHPFPQVANKSLNFIVKLGGKDDFGHENTIAIVKVPRVLPRVIRLPANLCAQQQHFVLLSSVIRAHLEELFPGRSIESFSQFRVTRDSDIDVDEDDVTNLRQALRSSLSTRNYGQAIRLEVVASCPTELSDFLLEQFALPHAALYRVNGPVNLVRLNALIDEVQGPALRYTPFEGGEPHPPVKDESLIDRIGRGDVLLHHPFQSFDPVLQFLREAVEDPNVLTIKQTIYRTGADSALMELLLEAVRRGKEVTVVVELKARFDEEANINWAERLERIGAQVVYGVVGHKTHAKLLLLLRREGRQLRRYVHLSTGNYNPKTARLYTDLALFTADPELTADAEQVFQQLASQTRTRPYRKLLVAPRDLHPAMVDLTAKVAQAAREGRDARIVVKCNALTDPGLIQALVEASQAGARIDLIIRGACMLPAGLAPWSSHIRVRSVIGRLLEHTRVFYFRWGDTDEDEALYLSSADWMSRNMQRRIELAWPIAAGPLRQRVIDEALVPYLLDTRDAWQQDAHGAYHRVDPEGISAQAALLARWSKPVA